MSEKEKELQELVDALRKSGQEMASEITHLRRSNAGLKGNNALSQHTIKELREMLYEREKVVTALHEQVLTINEKKRELEQTVQALEADKEYYESLPWWKRIFY